MSVAYDLYFKIFDNSGTLLTQGTVIDTNFNQDQSYVISKKDGFIVFYRDNTDNYYQKFDFNGNKVGSANKINGVATGGPQEPSIAFHEHSDNNNNNTYVLYPYDQSSTPKVYLAGSTKGYWDRWSNKQSKLKRYL